MESQDDYICHTCKTKMQWDRNVLICPNPICLNGYRYFRGTQLIHPEEFSCDNCDTYLVLIDPETECPKCGKIVKASDDEFHFTDLTIGGLKRAKKETGSYENFPTIGEACLSNRIGQVIGYYLEILNIAQPIDENKFFENFVNICLNFRNKKEERYDRKHYKDAMIAVLRKLNKLPPEIKKVS